jgi:hypothetical protein
MIMTKITMEVPLRPTLLRLWRLNPRGHREGRMFLCNNPTTTVTQMTRRYILPPNTHTTTKHCDKNGGGGSFCGA